MTTVHIVERKMTKEEKTIMDVLLKTYCEEELDQWELWKTDTKFGKVYITITREPMPDTQDYQYVEI